MAREMKVHYRTGGISWCGVDGSTTPEVAKVTCHRCKFVILVDAAPWARGFLDSIRKSPAETTPPHIHHWVDGTDPEQQACTGCDSTRMTPEEPVYEHLHWCAVHVGKNCNCRSL
jgi:hypothetical protein